MNPDADHQFCVPPALEDEIGTELKFAQRGERPSSFEMSSEPADKMTPAAPVAPFPTVPALEPAVSGTRDSRERERKREREKERKRVCVLERERKKKERERERERERVCVCV